jgi:hypothetical protein
MNPDCPYVADNYPVDRVKARYSQKEIDMLLCFLHPDILATAEPLTAYRIAVEKAFCEDMTGPAVDSLRRTYNAFRALKGLRNTPQWDEMINIEEELSSAG